ncbi:MAG: hypothetical protein ABR563_01775 [Pyrinomonadaceae bacterium]
MSLVFLITLALLAAIVYTIYRTSRDGEARGYELPPPQPSPHSLFDEAHAEEARGAAAQEAQKKTDEAARGALLARAAQGDFGALNEAASLRDDAFYGAALAQALKWAGESPERWQSLVEHLSTGRDLRGSVEVSRRFVGEWERSPDWASTTRALHLAALSDDAAEFSLVAGTAARLLREGRLGAMTGDELFALVESQFWLMSPAARTSGAAFVFKQKLAALRAGLLARAGETQPR